MNPTQPLTQSSARASRRRQVYGALVTLLLLNGVVGVSVWPRHRSGALNGCIVLRYMVAREVLVCRQSVASPALQPREDLPTWRQGDLNALRINVWHLDRERRSPHLLASVRLPLALLAALPLGASALLLLGLAVRTFTQRGWLVNKGQHLPRRTSHGP